MHLSQKFLAGAIIALLPLGSALACTTSAWSTTTGNPIADDPDVNINTNNNPDAGSVKRYAGNCGLAPASAAGSFVTNNNGSNATYRARFYVYTGITGGAPRVFEAYAGADGGGGTIFSVTYDRAGNDLDFTAAGTSVPSLAVSPNRWYSVEVLHQAGQIMTVSVEGANSAHTNSAALTTASQAAVAGNVGSARLGNVNGATLTFAGAPAANNNNGFSVDEFDSTRSATTAIGRLCRGDANNDAATNTGADLNGLDASTIVSERLGTGIAAGQPDTNEDGIVNGLDASLVITMRLNGIRCN